MPLPAMIGPAVMKKRGPYLPVSFPTLPDNASSIKLMGSKLTPAAVLEYPSSVCRYITRAKKKPLRAPYIAKVETFALVKLAEAKRRRLIIGSVFRHSKNKKNAKSPAPNIRGRTAVEFQPLVGPSISPNIIPVSEIIANKAPM